MKEKVNLQRDSRADARDEHSFEMLLEVLQTQIAKLLLAGQDKTRSRPASAAEVARTQ